jgi:hypothetical protein
MVPRHRWRFPPPTNTADLPTLTPTSTPTETATATPTPCGTVELPWATSAGTSVLRAQVATQRVPASRERMMVAILRSAKQPIS